VHALAIDRTLVGVLEKGHRWIFLLSPGIGGLVESSCRYIDCLWVGG